ncbi:MAG: lycopene cyclase domain-containing protein [Ferruginibacter sp.]|nr:lycopene cyclase domain-containing protein [Ferruginibacter sp.]
MNTQYTYFLILACSLAGPFALSFDKKVAFYKKWKYVFAAMLLPALFYIVWDSIFTSLQVWFFNEQYVVAKTFVYNLPLEEILFFFIVPYCCTFIYECIRTYFPAIKTTKASDNILFVLAIILLIISIFTHHLYYTFYTSIFLSGFIFIFFIFRKYFAGFNSKAFVFAYLIILIPFLIVNGFLTAIPVITYNNAENLATRIYTIPVEDIFYGMLLVMMNIVGYEKLLKRS